MNGTYISSFFNLKWMGLFFLLILCRTTADAIEPELQTLTMAEKEWLGQHSEDIPLWFNDNFPPIEYSDAEGNFNGMAADVIALVEKQLGITFAKTVSRDWNMNQAALESGACAVAPAIVKNADRAQYVLFSPVYAKIRAVIITTQNYGTGITFKDLSNKKVAVVSGSAIEKYLKSFNDLSLNFITFTHVPECLRAVAFGQADACVNNLAVASYHIGQQGITNLRVAGITDYISELRIGVSKKYPLLFSSIQKAVESPSPEALSAIQDRWIKLNLEVGLSSKTVERLKAVGIFLLLLIISLACISFILKRRLNEKLLRLQKAQDEIAKSEARYRSFFENAPLPMVELYTANGQALLNRGFTDTFGYSEEDIATIDDWWSLAYPDPEYREEVRQEWEHLVQEAIRSGKPIKGKSYQVTCKDGTVRTISVRATLVDESILVNLIDLSDIIKTKAELRASLERFQALFNLLPFSCVISDMDGRYLMANQYFCRKTGKTQEELIDRTLEEVGRTLDSDDKKRITEELIQKGEIHSVEIAVKLGEKREHILFSSRIIDWGAEKAILTTTLDITDRKNAEAALQESEERLKLAFDAASDGLWDLNLDTEDVYHSPNYFRMLGYEPGDFPGTFDTWKRMVHPDDIGRAKRQLFDYIEGKTDRYTTEFRMQTKKGDWKWIFSRGKIVERDENNKPVRVVGTHQDITERKQADAQLRQSEEKFSKIFAMAPSIVAISRMEDGCFVDVNDGFEEITGWEKSEVIGLTSTEIRFWAKPTLRSDLIKELEAGRDLLNLEVNFRRKNGTVRMGLYSARPINLSGELFILSVVQDITEIKKIEKERQELQKQLLQTQKMEAIGVLAGGIAHDFNNILSALMGFTDLAKMEAEGNNALVGYLDEVSAASLRARDLVRHILTFSRKADETTQIFSLNHLIKETLKFIRASIPASIEIRSELNTKTDQVLGDPTFFHQVLMNLFTNAAHAMKDKGGVLGVRLATIDITMDESAQFKGIKRGKYLELVVSDTGCGIPNALVDRIFEPFFTTKERGEGTGMGLSTVYGILKKMGGSVSVYSEEGLGTTFKILLPLQAGAAERKKARTKEPMVKGSGRVLVVDDEESIVKGTCGILTKLGYETTGMISSTEALAHFTSDPSGYDLVLTDMTMPQMTGLDFSKEIKRLNPDIPIILCTGFSHGLTKEKCRSIGIVDMVMKPIIASQLSRTVHHALNKE